MGRLGGAPPPRMTTAGGGSSVATKTDTKVDLHISLARPMYLSTLSVALFLGMIDRAIRLVVSITPDGRKFGGNGSLTNCCITGGRSLHFGPRDSIILLNNQRPQSFLLIPMCPEGLQWAKCMLLLSIDVVMSRFGMGMYFSSSVARDNGTEERWGGGASSM